MASCSVSSATLWRGLTCTGAAMRGATAAATGLGAGACGAMMGAAVLRKGRVSSAARAWMAARSPGLVF